MESEGLSTELRSLGDVVTFRAGSVFKPGEQGQCEGDIPFIKVSDLNLPANSHKIVAANNWVSFEAAKRLRTAIHPAGATVFAKIGVALTYNRRRLLTRDTAIDNNLMSAIPDGSKIRPDFLYYTLQCLDFNDIAKGSALPYVNIGDLKTLPIRLPSLQEQAEIGSLLGAFDDRIDLVRQTNATLEAIAQALFKSWFVDFDPVRAKAEGREPEGMDPATAALFPSKFEESELGFVPKGWKVGTFGDIAQPCKGSVTPLLSPTAEFDHYSLPAFDSGMMPTLELGEAIKSNKTPVPSDAVLISKLNPHIPRIWFVGDARPNAVCSTEFLVWRPATALPPEYIYCLASSAVFNSCMKQLVTGTSNSHQRVKPDHLRSMATLIPATEVAAAFGAIATPLMARVLQNRSAVRTLAALRETLLPPLISGKLRLPEVEKATKETVA